MRKELKSALGAKEAELKSALGAKEAELTSALGAKEAELKSALGAKEAELTSALGAKDAELTSALGAKDAELASALGAKDAELASLRITIRERDQEVPDPNDPLTACCTTIAVLGKGIKLFSKAKCGAQIAEDDQLSVLRRPAAQQLDISSSTTEPKAGNAVASVSEDKARGRRGSVASRVAVLVQEEQRTSTRDLGAMNPTHPSRSHSIKREAGHSCSNSELHRSNAVRGPHL